MSQICHTRNFLEKMHAILFIIKYRRTKKKLKVHNWHFCMFSSKNLIFVVNSISNRYNFKFLSIMYSKTTFEPVFKEIMSCLNWFNKHVCHKISHVLHEITLFPLLKTRTKMLCLYFAKSRSGTKSFNSFGVINCGEWIPIIYSSIMQFED